MRSKDKVKTHCHSKINFFVSWAVYFSLEAPFVGAFILICARFNFGIATSKDILTVHISISKKSIPKLEILTSGMLLLFR